MRTPFTRIRKMLAALLAVIMVAGLLPTAALAAEPTSFADVEGHWGAEAIATVVEAGLFNGIDENTFDPDGGMTRAMFVTVLYRLSGKLDGETVTGTATFADVAADAWYAKAVSWAVAAGITQGYDSAHFGPDDLVTREQMCVFMVRFLTYMDYDLSAYTAGDPFTDDAAISVWARESVYLAKAIGLIEGVGDNYFAPQDSASRASVAVIGARLMEKADELASAGETPAPTETPAPSEQPSGGSSGGGGGGGGSTTVALNSVYIARDAVNVTGAALRSGDEIYTYVAPQNSVYTIRWLVGGVVKSTDKVYTVSALDAGQTIKAEVTGTSGYTGTLTSAATGKVVADVDLNTPVDDPEQITAPVAVGESTTFVDGEGDPVEIPEGASVSLNVSQSSEEAPAEDQSAIVTTISESLGESLPEGEEIPAPTVISLDVNLTMTTAESEEETAIHPVGDTYVTLSAEALGLPDGADLDLYTFAASHTNKKGETERVPGEVVTIDGVQYVRFVLNGLSRIYIGNIPPLTVTFDTVGGTEIPEQKVKLGGYAVKPEPPVKDGWLFAGWDHDLTTENIIKDIKVTAIWVKGELAANDQITGKWGWENGESITDTTKPDSIAEPTVADGTVTIYVDTAVTYPANLRYILHVNGPEGATQAAVGDTAEAAVDNAEFKAVSGVFPGIVAEVTDENGTARTSNEILYIKWADENGVTLGLQSARLVVRTAQQAPGDYDTQTRMETKTVNRGFGTVEYFLTGGSNASGSLPDYAGTVNGYLSGYYNADEPIDYCLDTYGSFYDQFSSNGVTISDLDYTGVRIEITPFAGESFDANDLPYVYASYYDTDTQDEIPYAISSELKDGKLILTCDKPTRVGGENINITLSKGSMTQHLSFEVDNYVNESRNVETDSWSQALAYLADDTYNRVTYTGTADAKVTDALTLDTTQDLYITNADLVVSGTLTLNGDERSAAYVSVSKGSVTVADGGVIATNSQSEEQTRYYNAQINAKNGITVESGGSVQVPYCGYLRLYNRMGGFTLDSGANVNTEGVLYVERDPESEVANTIAGTVTIPGNANQQARLEVNDGLDLASTAQITTTDGGQFEVYGGLNTQAGSQINTSGRAVISGRSRLYGAITVSANTLRLQNAGYSTYNYGTITVAANARLDASGTVLVNEGIITGGGTLRVGELDDISLYDNGIEYVEVPDGSSWTPDNYDRYQFTHEPDAAVDVIYFIGELSNINNGTCDITVEN